MTARLTTAGTRPRRALLSSARRRVCRVVRAAGVAGRRVPRLNPRHWRNVMYKIDRLTKTLLVLLVIGVWGLLLQTVIPFSQVEAQPKGVANQSGQVPPVIKARGLIIVDEQGRERILMGAPMPDPPHEGKRINP